MTDETKDRMPPIPREGMDEEQRAAADELAAGPRRGVKGPFIPLLRSPQLMARLQKVGEYLRFESALPRRVSELVTLLVARTWTQQFEWGVHVKAALEAGTSQDTVDALRQGRRPAGMSRDEEMAYDFTAELLNHRGVSEETYRGCLETFGERGVVDVVALAGYFTTICMVLNVAHTPAEPGSVVSPLPRLPL